MTSFAARLLSPCLIALALAGCSVAEEGKGRHPPAGPGDRTAVDPSFVTSASCAECHREEHAKWSGSHHDLAMRVAGPQTVLGDFRDASFTHFGVTTRFFRRRGKFFVRTDGPDGAMADFEITYTFGVEPLQQYLIEFPDGRVQALDIAWDSRPKEQGGGRWFHLHPERPIGHGDRLHWTGLYLNWNYMCAECHATNLKKNYDPKTDRFRTTWSEINVGCEGCHGPGRRHVELARSLERRGAGWREDDPKGLEVRLGAAGSTVQIEACARCHSLRNAVRGDYEYGKGFMDQYLPALLLEDLYHADGQILDEVYVYGSFIQSKKHRQGVRCTDCHDPHTARPVASGNALCTRCHQPSPPSRFGMLERKDYDTRAHHFHEPGAPGSRCTECHMPSRNYMVIDARLDHSFVIPRPDLTVKIGTPNACNGCHEDRPPEWAADRIRAWYPAGPGGPAGEPHFGEIFAAARAGNPDAETPLTRIAADRARPAIVRATALSLLSEYGSAPALDEMIASLGDGDPMIRHTALGGVSAMLPRTLGPGAQRRKREAVAPLLVDAVRAVRIEAARVLAEVPASSLALDARRRRAFDAALAEFEGLQDFQADRPDAHRNLGALYRNLGQTDRARLSFLEAIRLDEDYLPARFNLVDLYEALGRHQDAELQLRGIIERAPESGEAHYMLGLLLAGMNRPVEAAASLARGAELLPGRARVRYNLAVVLMRSGKRDEAERALREAYAIDPRDTDTVRTLAVFYLEQNQPGKALVFADALVAMAPESPEALRLRQRVLQETKSP